MRLLHPLLLALCLLAACSSPEPAQPTAVLSATESAPTPDDVTSPTVEPTATPTEPLPTATVPATVLPTLVPTVPIVASCNDQFTQLIAQFERDQAQRKSEDSAITNQCELPQSTISSQQLRENINIEIVLDASGSMGDALGESTRLAVAQAVLTDFVATLPDDAQVALRVFGHTGSRDEADKALSCEGAELMYPFQPLSTDEFLVAVNAFEPTGWTPTAVIDDFAGLDSAENSNFVYLISDGLETCDGDPADAAAQLLASNVGVEVNVIGFAVDAATTAELEAAAAAGGGSYFTANDAAALRDVFIEQIDWGAWGQYRACLVDSAAAAFTDSVDDESVVFGCSMQLVSDETADMLAAVAADEQYAQCQTELTARALDRQTTLHTTLINAFQAVMDSAESDFDQEVQEAEDANNP